ncbi:conserved phage C-terminal domain-containing protein [Listeria monocytogenes]|nr:conserved phage C-terminal domain-containing protein [Listeria monocytogenes]EIQ6467006.1 conserved phage C-terminal domain-containing protein [Listeria monocytogenes]EIQ6472794.1 conserved phage C-terminal domain-containing protein [Listeria monocytogenes]EJH5080505.1 conserved phage C-terminal domain-containing protein [Listeria monocytogenes]EJH5083374.1 conserved phage C-terminal domain-containing protein [Listeria monocytogenes]
MSVINNNNLLINDYPLQVLPALAREIGLNEAIVLQQIHYWLNKKQNLIDGKYWTYGSAKKWQEENFSFWSMNTVKRTFTSLKQQGLLITANYNKRKFDKTVWYSINYKRLDLLSQQLAQRKLAIDPNWANRQPHNEPAMDPFWVGASALNEPTNTLDLKEVYKENKKNIVEFVDDAPIFKNVIDFLNENAETKYKHTTKSTQALIKARLNDGFGFEDFKKVIIIKCKDWKNDSAMDQYLRPATLFGTKFESYLNQKLISGNRKKPWEKETKKEVLPDWFDKDQNQVAKKEKLSVEETKALEDQVAEIKARLNAEKKVYTDDEKAQIKQKFEEAQAKHKENQRKRGL